MGDAASDTSVAQALGVTHRVTPPSKVAREASAESAPPCRPGCGACCIAPSITSPLPGLPQGKPAGMACPHLDAELRCQLFGDPRRPAVCSGLQPSHEMCGPTRMHALAWLTRLEDATRP